MFIFMLIVKLYTLSIKKTKKQKKQKNKKQKTKNKNCYPIINCSNSNLLFIYSDEDDLGRRIRLNSRFIYHYQALFLLGDYGLSEASRQYFEFSMHGLVWEHYCGLVRLLRTILWSYIVFYVVFVVGTELAFF